jgi:hypothetical protein
MLKTQQGSRVTIVIVQVGAMKIDVAAVHTLGKMERQDETQLFRFVKFSFPIMRLMPYYAETGCSCPP